MSNQVYSTGRRKESIAKVWVSNGTELKQFKIHV